MLCVVMAVAEVVGSRVSRWVMSQDGQSRLNAVRRRRAH